MLIVIILNAIKLSVIAPYSLDYSFTHDINLISCFNSLLLDAVADKLINVQVMHRNELRQRPVI
jgi:hypothetical protein